MGLYCLANELSTFKNKSAMKVRVIRTGFVMEKKGSSEIKGKEVIFHEEDEEGKHNQGLEQLTLSIISTFNRTCLRHRVGDADEEKLRRRGCEVERGAEWSGRPRDFDG
nr:uncharacterized protein LOC109174218 [Ipomoea batatas]